MRELSNFLCDDMKCDFTEKTMSSEIVYTGEFLQVKRDVSLLVDGSEAKRENVVHPGAAMIIPLFKDRSILLERQYRYAVGIHCIEFPAGRSERGEDPITTAKRELVEETGYLADTWENLGLIHPGVGYTNEKIHIFLAKNLKMTNVARDEGEFLETFRISLDDAIVKLKAGEITDAKTIVGLFKLLERFKKV